MKLIYISNTRIPSEKANTYQSMVMCEAFSQYFDEVEFWYPDMRNTTEMLKIDNPYKFYSIKETFKLKKIKCFDNDILFKYFNKVWFVSRSVTFGFNIALNLRKEPGDSLIFIRDVIGVKFLVLLKKLGLIKQKIFFEAHVYSKNISKLNKNIDGLVVINNYLKTLYEKEGIKNILVAHDGVKINEYKDIKFKSESISSIKNIVYIGNLFKWKGVYTLVDSIKYFDKNIKFIVIGGSNDTLPFFKEYVKKNNIKNIEIIGFVQKKETLKYIEKSDVLVLPNSAKDKMSYYTSPLKLFEYMASKRPIVASRLPSIEEVLQDKKNSILCEPDNSKDLADKIKWCLENDTTKIVNQAYQDVQNYTWDKRAQKIVNWMKNER